MIQNVTGIRKVPSVPDNRERVSDFRAKVAPELANAFPWPWLQEAFDREFGEAYAREQCASEPITNYADRRGE